MEEGCVVDLVLMKVSAATFEANLLNDRPNSGPSINVAPFSALWIGEDATLGSKHKSHTLRNHLMLHPNSHSVVAMFGAEVEEFCEGLVGCHILNLTFIYLLRQPPYAASTSRRGYQPP